MVKEFDRRLIKKIYITYIILLFLFALFAYYYQYSMNIEEDKTREETFYVEDKHGDEAGHFKLYLGSFTSEAEARSFLAGQDTKVVQDLENAFQLGFSQNHIIISNLDSYDLADMLGQRLMRHFNISSYEVMPNHK